MRHRTFIAMLEHLSQNMNGIGWCYVKIIPPQLNCTPKSKIWHSNNVQTYPIKLPHNTTRQFIYHLLAWWSLDGFRSMRSSYTELWDKWKIKYPWIINYQLFMLFIRKKYKRKEKKAKRMEGRPIPLHFYFICLLLTGNIRRWSSDGFQWVTPSSKIFIYNNRSQLNTNDACSIRCVMIIFSSLCVFNKVPTQCARIRVERAWRRSENGWKFWSDDILRKRGRWNGRMWDTLWPTNNRKLYRT